MLRVILPVLMILVLVAVFVASIQRGQPITGLPDNEKPEDVAVVPVSFQGDRSTWQLLALSDEELEKVSLVELNLAVVKEIPGHEDLDLAQYEQIIDQWTREFAAELPLIDASFIGREAEFQNDLRFYRIGQLMTWLGHKKSIRYIPEQRDLDRVIYQDAGELFLHGLIDSKLGTCGNMPTLQAAIARRLGWPVSLAPVESHTLCRFDDGEVVYNIETTHTDKGGFSAGTNQDYIDEFNIPACAMTEGDTLETMNAREMLGYFISLRARYYRDTGDWQKAEQDYSLARALLPRHRKLLLASLEMTLRRSNDIFDDREAEHPIRLCALIGQDYARHQARRQQQRQDPLAEIARINRMNAENQRRMQMMFEQHQQTPQHNDPWHVPSNHQNGTYNPFP